MVERFLIIGLGSIGRRHLANLRKLRPESQIAILRSRSTATTDILAAEVDAQFNDWQQVLMFKPDASIICNPASCHIETAYTLIPLHVPILIEKPIANNLIGLRAFVDEVTSKQLHVVVGYNLRLLPSLIQAKRLIEEGAIGNVLTVRGEVGQYLPDWRPNRPYQDGVSAKHALGGGPLLELSHEFDYLYWMFGLPDKVTARGGRFSDLNIDVDDVVEITLEYPGHDKIVSLHLDFLQHAPDRHCKFIGSSGTLIWNGIANNLELYRSSTRQWERFNFFPNDRNQMYLDEITEFLDFKTGATTNLARVSEGYDVVAIVDAAVESMKQQTTVKVYGYAKANK